MNECNVSFVSLCNELHVPLWNQEHGKKSLKKSL